MTAGWDTKTLSNALGVACAGTIFAMVSLVAGTEVVTAVAAAKSKLSSKAEPKSNCVGCD